MATHNDYIAEMQRLAQEFVREQQAIEKAVDLHGGDIHPEAAPFPTIITQFGTWAVTAFGVECLIHPYQIQWDSLTDDRFDLDFWLRNMAKKDWVVMRDFVQALRHGRNIHMYINVTSREA